MAMLDDVKIALRITSTAYDAEISSLIDVATADLQLSGVTSESAITTDTLIKQAVIVYVKANFGYDNPDADRFQRSYDMLKQHLTLAKEYAYYTVTFTITDASDESVIREATVTFDGEVKGTGEAGTVVFYKRAGNNYKYTVTADDYQADDDEENLIDVTTAAVDIAIALTGN